MNIEIGQFARLHYSLTMMFRHTPTFSRTNNSPLSINGTLSFLPLPLTKSVQLESVYHSFFSYVDGNTVTGIKVSKSLCTLAVLFAFLTSAHWKRTQCCLTPIDYGVVVILILSVNSLSAFIASINISINMLLSFSLYV